MLKCYITHTDHTMQVANMWLDDSPGGCFWHMSYDSCQLDGQLLAACSRLHLNQTRSAWTRARTSLDGGLQLAQARGDLRVHLALPRGVLREGVPVGAERLADLAAA